MPQMIACRHFKAYTNSSIEHLGVLRHKDKVARCRFFVVPGDFPALLELQDIKVLAILEIMCEVVNGQQVGRKFDSQIMQPSSALSFKTYTKIDCRSHSMGINQNITNKLLCRFLILLHY